MPTVEIRIDSGGIDGVPHVFLVLTDQFGNEHGWGFAPAEHLDWWGPGKVYDDTLHEYDQSWSQEITQDQFIDLQSYIGHRSRSPGYYEAWERNCVGFVGDALRFAKIEDVASGPLTHPLELWWHHKLAPYWKEYISDPLNDLYLAARHIILNDPLALDLDGDGIETVGIAAGIQFDHNADGITTGTGWLKGDDAFLVLDRNGNGLIDSGRELFGVDTQIGTDIAGNAEYATDGFDALRSIDSNGDGLFNASDAQYAAVRLWQDTNQDGISQADELVSLSDAGITGIDLNAKRATQTLAGGNTQTLTADIAGLAGDAAALNLADNPFYRTYTDSLDTTMVADLPDMQGSGLVRDLREAATQSASLEQQLRSLKNQGYVDRDTYLAQIKALIDAWADTSSLETADTRAELGYFELQSYGGTATSVGKHYIEGTGTGMDATSGYVINIIYQPSGVDRTLLEREAGVAMVGAGGGGSAGTAVGDPLNLSEAEQAAQLAKWRRATYLIETLERFNGQTFVNLEPDGTATSGEVQTINIGTGGNTNTGGGGANGAGGGLYPVFVRLFNYQLDLLEQSYAELVKSVYDGLLLQTRLSSYTDAIDLVIDETGIRLDFTAMDQMLQTRYQANARQGIEDIVDLARSNGAMFMANGWDGLGRLGAWLQEGDGAANNAEALGRELGLSLPSNMGCDAAGRAVWREPAKVSRGGTPRNGAWRRAA